MKTMNEEKLARMAEFIHRYIEENNGRSPKFSEILAHMEMSNSVGYRYLTVLRDRGVVEYKGRDTLRVKGQETMHSKALRIPIFGAIPCGTPDDYRQEIRGYVAVPEEWITGDCYLLRATGDSMVDVGIDDGDLVLIERTDEVFDGQIAAVLTEDGTTLKRYRTDGKRPYLQAENKGYAEAKRFLYPREIRVQGLARKVIKELK